MVNKCLTIIHSIQRERIVCLVNDARETENAHAKEQN